MACSRMWYGKGPGVDRTGDVFRHANLAGTAKHGGVLALMGDDHTAESSTTAHQSEYHFIDVMIPILNPAGVQEVLDYGLYGWAMSRFTGTWVALKTMHETIESTAAIDASFDRINIVTPTDFVMPDGGLNIRLNDPILAQEARLHDYKRDAMLAFLRANKINRTITSGGREPEDRHHHHRQELSRRPPGVRRTRHRRGQMQRARHPALQGRLPVADQPARAGRIRRRARSHHRRRGEALADRSAGARGALRHRQSAGLHRQKRRSRATGCFRSRARSIPTKSRSASASGCSSIIATTSIAQRVARLEGVPAHRRRDARHRPAHSVFLLRLPAQFLDRRAGRHARLCGHRLPLHGAMDGPLDARLHADGRRGRQLGRRSAVLQPQPRVPESRRRHLQSFRLHGDPRRDRLEHQHHLQDPVQRRGGDDRRPGQ